MAITRYRSIPTNPVGVRRLLARSRSADQVDPNESAEPELPAIVPLPLQREELIPLLSFPQPSEFRAGEYLHVSDLVRNVCIRKIALSEQHHLPIPAETLWPNTRVTFRQGEAIADVVVKDLTQSADDALYGRWECVCGQSCIEGTYVRALEQPLCTACQGPLDQYRECNFVDEEYKLSGSVDVLLYTENAFYITEIKSKKHELWAALEAPDPDHAIQVLFYYWLLLRNNRPVHDKVSILYVTKQHTQKSPYKEFVLQPSKMLRRLDDYLEEAKDYAVYRTNGQLPPKTHCSTQVCPKAKACHVSVPCFDHYRRDTQ